MTIRLAINGFGRIGRCVLRALYEQKRWDDVQVVAINTLGDLETNAHLLRYDTTHGRFASKVEILDGQDFAVDGDKIKMFSTRDPHEIDWASCDVDVVLECTGAFRTREKAAYHLESGAKKVLISAPGTDCDATVVYGVNDDVLTSDMKIVSNASCTTNCLAPMANTLNKLAKIKKGYMTTIHAYTGDQMVLDGPHRKGDLRRARAAAVNIVPNSTGAAKAIGLVIPELNGVLDGCAQRVPVPTGSLTQLVAICEGEVDAATVNAAMKAAASASFGYTEEELVSSDIVGITYGSLFDATQTKCMPMGDGTTLVKVVSWYDNENSYTSQMVRTIKYFAEL